MGRNGCIALLEDVTDTAILPTIEEAPNLPPELIDEEGEEATLTTFPRLEINSRPQRTRRLQTASILLLSQTILYF